MIYSATLFSKEFKLLNLKVEEETRGGVDKVFVAECERTFRNTPKPLILKDHPNRPPGIEVVEVLGSEFDAIEDDDQLMAAYKREGVQRDAPLRAMNLQDDDVVICSDVDEIFPSQDIEMIVAEARKVGFVHLLQRNFLYKINWMTSFFWGSPFAITGQFLNSGLGIQRMRVQQGNKVMTNGKHLGYLMGAEEISEKLKGFPPCFSRECEAVDSIQSAMSKKRDPFGRGVELHPIRLDFTYPDGILNNINDWKEFVDEETDTPMDSVEMAKIVALYSNTKEWKRYDELYG